MRLGVVGSRSLRPDIAPHIPSGVTEIVTGGAEGADAAAMAYARAWELRLTVHRPDYKLLGRQAPLARNQLIVDGADSLLAFWDGESRGTLHTIAYALDRGKPCRVIRMTPMHRVPRPSEEDCLPWQLKEFR